MVGERPACISAKLAKAYVNVMQEIESGNFAVPRWLFCPPDSIRVVNWNIDRGSKLRGVIEFLDGAKADIILLQEDDIRFCADEELNHPTELGTTVNVPVHNAYGIGRTKKPARDCEVATFNLLHNVHIRLCEFGRDACGCSPTMGLKSTRKIPHDEIKQHAV